MGRIYKYSPDGNFLNDWLSSTFCIGRYDENGYIYNREFGNFRGYEEDDCIGYVDSDGYVYRGRPGIMDDNNVYSDRCCGRVFSKKWIFSDKYVDDINKAVAYVDDLGRIYLNNGMKPEQAYVGSVDKDSNFDQAAAAAVLLMGVNTIPVPRMYNNSQKANRGNNSGDSVLGLILAFFGQFKMIFDLTKEIRALKQFRASRKEIAKKKFALFFGSLLLAFELFVIILLVGGVILFFTQCVG